MARLPRSNRTSPLMFYFKSFSSSAAWGKVSTGLGWELSGGGGRVSICLLRGRIPLTVSRDLHPGYSQPSLRDLACWFTLYPGAPLIFCTLHQIELTKRLSSRKAA